MKTEQHWDTWSPDWGGDTVQGLANQPNKAVYFRQPIQAHAIKPLQADVFKPLQAAAMRLLQANAIKPLQADDICTQAIPCLQNTLMFFH